jgi:hypothetical protein
VVRELYARGNRAGACLALIGPRWVEELRKRAAIREEDMVGKEVAWALRDWPGKLIPVVIDANLPAKTLLPRTVEGLLRYQAVSLRRESWEPDLANLVDELRTLERSVERSRTPERDPSNLPERLPDAGGGARVPAPGPHHLREVIDAMIDEYGSVVPVLGPGARGTPPDSVRLATGLLERFAKRIAKSDGDLADIAQRVLLIQGERELYRESRAGDLSWKSRYVITEGQYIEYLPAELPVAIRDKLTGSHCLFLGYRLGEWNARVLLHRVWNEGFKETSGDR